MVAISLFEDPQMSRSAWCALQLSCAVAEFDMNGFLFAANANFLDMFGYDADVLIGDHHSRLCDAETVNDPAYLRFWHDLSAGQFKTGRFKRYRSDGQAVWIQASYNPVRSPDGGWSRVVKVATDISREVELEEQLHGQMARDAEISERLAEQNKAMELTIADLSGIVDTVSVVARHTNMLALNAVLEAARAGDAGRGFAVVAGEVKKLAAESREATEKAREMLCRHTRMVQRHIDAIDRAA